MRLLYFGWVRARIGISGETLEPPANVIDVYVNHLRKKIDKNFSTKLLHTLRGVGYVMKV